MLLSKGLSIASAYYLLIFSAFLILVGTPIAYND
jgi:hypothetical protein